MSMSSDTRLQATRPIEPMLRKARMVSGCRSSTYSRRPWKLASPAEPASAIAVTPCASPPWSARTEMSVPPCQTWTCRSAQPGDSQLPLQSSVSAPGSGAARNMPSAPTCSVSGTGPSKPTGLKWGSVRPAMSELPRKARIKRVAQAVAGDLQRQHAERNRDARKENDPVGIADILAAFVDHRTPGWGRGIDANAEERQTRFRQHGVGKNERRLYDDRRGDVAQDV